MKGEGKKEKKIAQSHTETYEIDLWDLILLSSLNS